MAGLRYGDAGEHSLLELCPFALHALEDLPVGKGSKHRKIADVLRDQVELPVVRRKDDDLAERADRCDESLRICLPVGAEERFRVA